MLIEYMYRFVNYFGLQRFGSGAVPSVAVGRCMLRRDDSGVMAEIFDTSRCSLRAEKRAKQAFKRGRKVEVFAWSCGKVHAHVCGIGDSFIQVCGISGEECTCIAGVHTLFLFGPLKAPVACVCVC